MDKLKISHFIWTGDPHKTTHYLEFDYKGARYFVPNEQKPTLTQIGAVVIVGVDDPYAEPIALQRRIPPFKAGDLIFKGAELQNVTNDPALFYLHEMTQIWNNAGKSKLGPLPDNLIARAMQLRKEKELHPKKDVRVYYTNEQYAPVELKEAQNGR